MTTESSAITGLRAAIIGETKRFLVGLDTGLSDEQLTSILSDIRDKELQLIKAEGSMLDPEIWELLQSRLANRRKKDIIDTTEY
jgi:hypothetical protein